MIISASRRTDIPALYAKWFIQRVLAGFCEVPNPFNPSLRTHVSLLPADVDGIVFWTRNPRPLFPYLELLDNLGYHYIFLFTLLGYPKSLDQHSPPLLSSIRTFQALSSRIGPERVIWRYDPIIITPKTPIEYHITQFNAISSQLHKTTQRVIISFVDLYRKANKRLSRLADLGYPITPKISLKEEEFIKLLTNLVQISELYGMQLFYCADQAFHMKYGGNPGRCIDAQLLNKIFGLQINHTKDPAQRENCGCSISRDIGMYDTCIFGCQYCYANKDFGVSWNNYRSHNPSSPSLI